MSLKSIFLRDFVIVHQLEIELAGGFTVLTGQTGAGKSILIDALQLALGARADAGVVREGAARCEISACFDCPAFLRGWLEESGLAFSEELLLKRTVDAQGRAAPGSMAAQPQRPNCASWANAWLTSTDSTPGKA